ncbi:MAG: ATP-binding protein [Acidobacteria bacterium]|nr:ATP-binding protein [Acidobacteriota bacterium]
MLIPERFEEKLTQDRSLRRSVDDAVAEFEPWLRESKLPFFPDYTNHGAEHVEGILITASSIIGDEAWDAVTPADAATLVLATLLHDCAMHLTEDGFQALVSGAKHTKRIQGFGDAPWPELWQEFLFSAKRFDDRALVALFGRPVAVRTPPADKGELTLNDRYLIGEFVRRHHPRLAHEIAVRGVPGPTRNPIRLSERLDEKLADIAGLVARSHGLPLRATFDYLNARYHRREYKGVHAVFLMAVLRVSDYLQIQAERAPRQMLQVKDIRSPFSRREWRAHHSVDNITTYEDDPEAILVQATPPDVLTYLRLKEWLGGIQEELDTSWAVLGEVYGPVEKLRRLGLVIRRVRSNLDDARAFSQHVEYVPRRVEFDIARSEILKLLVRPLYGDKPEIGIRELLQNSVDAVRELWDLQEQNPALKNADLIEQEADVVTWLDEPDETGRATFTISDRGVGMTEEVITDYFLKVGASYRHSDAWAKQHERPDEETDSDTTTPKSRVLRSGRFGIGALAAFLLGDEIEVSTRHVHAPTGIRFTTRLDSEPVELCHDDSLKVGTTIRMTLSQGKFEQLAYRYGTPLSADSLDYEHEYHAHQDKWDWYCLSMPSVLRLFGSKRKRLPQELHLPSLGNKLPLAWFEINEPRFQAVYSTPHLSGVICNGMQIKSEHGQRFPITEMFFSEDEIMRVPSPLVSIFDPDGNLPLTLTRDALIYDEYIHNIYEAKMMYALAYLILSVPPNDHHIGLPKPEVIYSSVPHARYDTMPWPWLYTKVGLGICELPNLVQNRIKCALILNTFDWASPTFCPKNTHHDGILLLNHTMEVYVPGNLNHMMEVYAQEKAFEDLISGFNLMFAGPQRPRRPWGNTARVLTTKAYGEIMLKRYQVLGTLELREDWSNELWMLLATGAYPKTKFDLSFLDSLSIPDMPSGVIPMAAEWFLENKQDEVEYEGLAYYWKEIIREPVIPYDLQERRKKLAHAYNVLAPYMDKIAGDMWAETGKTGRRRRVRDKKR